MYRQSHMVRCSKEQKGSQEGHLKANSWRCSREQVAQGRECQAGENGSGKAPGATVGCMSRVSLWLLGLLPSLYVAFIYNLNLGHQSVGLSRF